MAERKRLVNYKFISKKTGNVLHSGGIYVVASDTYEAEGKALAQLKKNPPCQSTEGVIIEVKCNDW